MSHFASAPPPLERRRAPFAVTVRALMWRGRFVVVAVCLAAVASSVVDALRPPEPPTVGVVVAARALPAGRTLGVDDVRLVRLPVAVAPDGAAHGAAALLGAATAVPLTAGTPVVPGLLVPDDLAGPPGTVVAAVRLADPAVASLLAAGMRVDVLSATPDDERGRVVAARALVLPAPPAAADEPGPFAVPAGDDTSYPVLLAVAPDEVDELAAAAASALLSAVVVP
ncbi:SAF domain-containing protein [Cellulomonas edaphi]|uniref:SAF domain-containing protein n=1 Tax=Cellulomonas edaphi TaxID=3053468 RepID=A0ABT7S4T1_9CELL|nr:SAF domain-containing protein [Cellulomons edaphi]MDM7830638.1 SAF domain-containing protein [Cellulomons edaphi]